VKVAIITPNNTLFEGNEIQSVILPGKDGKFELLENHAPIIATLKEGEIVIRSSVSTEKIKIKNGLVECLKNEVSILVED
jgi:F-type H+-transporting ATPase subunit epsilon